MTYFKRQITKKLRFKYKRLKTKITTKIVEKKHI